MSRLRALLPALLSLAAVTLSCSKEPIGPRFTPFDFSFAEAAGDTLMTSGATSAARATDLVQASGRVEAEVVVLTLTFAAPIQPWSSGAANALDGFVDFDMDDNAATGLTGAVNEYGGTSGVGAEAYLSLRDDGSGHLAVADVAGRQFSTIAATFTATSVTAIIPRAYLRVPGSEHFRISAVVGNHDRPATDFAPDSSYFQVAR